MNNDLHNLYRPADFTEMYGQDAIVNSMIALEKDVIAGKKEWPHAYLLVGEAGCGKCVTGDTRVLTEHGLLKIESLSRGVEGFTDFSIGLLSTAGVQNSSHFFEEMADSTIKVTNYLGITIQGTPEHKVLVFDSCMAFVFKRLDELEVGDTLCVERTQGLFPNKNAPINFTFSYGPAHAKHANACQELRDVLPSEMRPDIARMLGYVVANGCFSETVAGSIAIATKNTDIRSDIDSILQHYHQRPVLWKNDVDGIIPFEFSKLIRQLCGQDNNTTARYKKVPDCVLRSSKEIQLSFLQALIDCDSYVSKEGVLEYYTASSELVRDVQLMLLNLGVVARIRSHYDEKYAHTYHDLVVNKLDMKTYFSQVNSLKYKDIILDSDKSHTNIDGAPCARYVSASLTELKQLLKVSKNGKYTYKETQHLWLPRLTEMTQDLSKNTILTRRRLTELVQILTDSPFSGFIACQVLIDKLSALQRNFYFFSDVTHVDRIEEPVKVYDFTVPEFHNFVANGIVNHNTTTARILAKKFGCEPCNIREVDSATYTSIDSIRQLTSTLNYKAFGKMPNKVYILDEVHRLSASAFDALLKSLEEPPPHVYFMLCTTNRAKVPKTIVSRCLEYTFKLLKPNELSLLVEDVCAAEGITLPDGVGDLVARKAEGSPRMALTALAKVANAKDRKEAASLLETVGEEDSIIELCRMMVSRKGFTWGNAVELIKGLQDESPESVRMVVLSYVSKVLMGTSTDKAALPLLEILDKFSKPFNTSEKMAPLLLAVGELLFGEDE